MENSENTLKILLTAGASDLGMALIRQLASAGHQVFASVGTNQDAKTTRKLGGIPVFIDTTRDSEIASSLRMAKADVAINLDVQSFNSPPSVATNWSAEHVIASTTAMVAAVESAGTPYMIHISPAFIYDESDAPVNEDGKLRRSGDHPLINAVLKAEKAVNASPVKSTIIRAGYTYGAESVNMATLKQAILAGRTLPTGNKPASWVYVDDLAQAIALTVAQQPDNAVLNVTDGVYASPAEFLNQFGHGLGVDGVVQGTGFFAGLFGGNIAGDLVGFSAQADNATAKEVLGWKPRYATHEDGIDQLLISWRAKQTV